MNEQGSKRPASVVALNPIEAEARKALDGGDHREALSVLMRGYGDSVFGRCRMILGRHDWAEEATQNTFIEAYRSFDRFEGRSSLRTWLFGIARHRSLDFVKQAHVRRELATDAPPEQVDTASSPEDTLANASVKGPLDECLRKLSTDKRLAVVMRYQEGMSFKEMARIFGEEAGTLERRVARAMPELQRCLRARGIDYE